MIVMLVPAKRPLLNNITANTHSEMSEEMFVCDHSYLRDIILVVTQI